MESDRLLVLYPQKRGPEKERSRMDEVLGAALDGIDTEIVEDMEILEQDPFKYRGRRLLFAVPLGRNGINRGYYEVLAWLRGGIPLSRATCCARMPRPITGTRLP